MVKQATENKPEVNKTNQTYTLKNGKRDRSTNSKCNKNEDIVQNKSYLGTCVWQAIKVENRCLGCFPDTG